MSRPARVIHPHASRLLGPSLYRTTRELRRVLRRSLRQSWPLDPLAPAEVELMRLVADRPGVRVGEAAETLRVAPNTVSSLVRRLVDAGLVNRERADTDARAVRLDVTPAARRRVELWQDRGAMLMDRALGELSAAERDAIAAALPALSHLASAIEGLEEG